MQTCFIWPWRIMPRNGVETQRYFEKAAPLVETEEQGCGFCRIDFAGSFEALAGEAGTLLKIDPVHLRKTTQAC